MKKLVIIPAYNESESIKNTVEEIKNKAQGFDYVVVNDCSKDDTQKICEENGYDLAVQVDGDGQHNPEFLIKMAEYLQNNSVDMVIGSRFIEKEGFQSSGARRIGIKYFTILIKLLTGVKITDPTSGLRIVNREIMGMFAYEYPKDYPEPESVVSVLRGGKKVAEIPVVMRERLGGVSSISLKKSVYYMIKVTLSILIECLRR